jgi:chaperonin GroES
MSSSHNLTNVKQDKKGEPLETNNLSGGYKMASSIQPLHDRVLIKRIEEPEVAPGGIIIPDTAKEKPQKGEVIAAGQGKVNANGKRQPMDVKPGDRVLFGKYSGSDVVIDGEDYLIMREDEILGIFVAAAKAKGAR